MSILNDHDLLELSKGRPAPLEGFKIPDDPYSQESCIQPCSLDLTIGDIYLPRAKATGRGGVQSPAKEHVLKRGRTAIVLTAERIRLPSDVAGIGFPPSHVSFKGILMTNPGHLDPGYEGGMRFAVINMGREDYILRKGDAIVTVLLFKNATSCTQDWRQRGNSASPISQEDLDRLSVDFLDLDDRATQIAKGQVTKAGFLQAFIPVVIAIIAAASAYWAGQQQSANELNKQISAMSSRVQKMEETRNIEDELNKQILQVSSRLEEIKETQTIKDRLGALEAKQKPTLEAPSPSAPSTH